MSPKDHPAPTTTIHAVIGATLSAIPGAENQKIKMTLPKLRFQHMHVKDLAADDDHRERSVDTQYQEQDDTYDLGHHMLREDNSPVRQTEGEDLLLLSFLTFIFTVY